MKALFTDIAATSLIFILVGCASHRNGVEQGNYQTVGKDPHRDTELARKLNDQAVDDLNKENYDGAEKELKQALDADITFGPAHNNLGTVYFQHHRLYLAAWEYQYAIKLMPGQAEPRNNLGLVLEQVGKLDDAVENYAKAKELAPEEPQFIGNLARARIRRGDKGNDIKELLTQVVLHDSRPEWSEWAKEQSARLGSTEKGP